MPAGTPRWWIASTSVPERDRRAASSSARRPGSTYSRSHDIGTLTRTAPGSAGRSRRSSRRSGTPKRIIAMRSRPQPKAKPVYRSGSMPQRRQHVRIDHPGPRQLEPAGPPGLVDVRDLDVHRGLGEREEVRLEDDLAVGAQQLAREVQHRALEVGHRQPLVHREALHLLEHRAVGGVDVVAAVDEARARRGRSAARSLLHRAHLHRRGLAAQQPVRVALQVEVVARRARRVALRRVEGGEVVPLGLDLGAVGDAVAEGEEDVLHLPADLRDRVERPARVGVAGQRDVGRSRSSAAPELLGLELGGAGRERLLDGRRGPRWRRGPTAPALLRRERRRCRPARSARRLRRPVCATRAASSSDRLAGGPHGGERLRARCRRDPRCSSAVAGYRTRPPRPAGERPLAPGLGEQRRARGGDVQRLRAGAWGIVTRTTARSAPSCVERSAEARRARRRARARAAA